MESKEPVDRLDNARQTRAREANPTVPRALTDIRDAAETLLEVGNARDVGFDTSRTRFCIHNETVSINK